MVYSQYNTGAYFGVNAIIVTEVTDRKWREPRWQVLAEKGNYTGSDFHSTGKCVAHRRFTKSTVCKTWDYLFILAFSLKQK
jgi:hypothetical protein